MPNRFQTGYYRVAGLMFFRILGFGLHAKNIAIRPLLYKERLPRLNAVTVAGWRLRLLHPWDF